VLALPAHSGAVAGAAAALERLFTGPLESSLDTGAKLDCELDELPSMAARVLHEHLMVGESEPLVIEFGSDILPDEP
jgi:hypothetical protein